MVWICTKHGTWITWWIYYVLNNFIMIGKEILNYTILSLIGKGGMGSVYLAEHKFIKQQKVAIKVINSNMINDFTRQRLAEEADRLARLNHPNIVHFINYHTDDEGNIYLIMEYADGYSLENYIKSVSGLIVEEKICAFFEPLLDAFEYAHKHKIIHKDIKPSNIVITNDGVPKILDFGIATLLDDMGESNEKDMIMGTPSYMSPEQVRGETLDQRSDIYSLGVLLHQMLTGNPPYDTTTMTEHDIYKHVVEESLPRMKTYYKYVSDKVQAIVDKATNKKKEQRFQSCGDFKKALHNALNPKKVSKGLISIVAAVAAVLLVGVFFAWDYNRVKVYYYKDYVEQWGVPQGIGKISSSDHNQTHRMYRFEYKNYKLQRVSHVNSLDIIVSDGESERIDRPLDIMFYYNDDDRLSRAKVLDNNGQVLYIKSYNESLNTVIFQFNDEYGTEKTIGNETVGYVDVFATNQTRGRISRYLYEYDEDGYVTTVRYAGFQNVYVCDANGIYGKCYVRDEQGRVIEETYLGHDGTPMATNWGLGKKLFYYDEEDNWVKAVYLSVDGEPSLDADDGVAIYELEYDACGNVIAVYYKNHEGGFMLPEMYGVAGYLYEYDDNGFICKQSAVGVDGVVEFSARHQCAIILCECNEYGFVVKQTYCDADGNMCANREGSAYVTSVTDERGNCLEWWSYGVDGELAETQYGNAGKKMEYDEKGCVIKETYYGVDGEPCLVADGIAGYTYEYNEMGDMIKQSALGVDMLPTLDSNNVCTMVFVRDIRGNITKLSNYNEEGELTISNNGVAIIEFVYDERGNEISRKFFDVDGNPTRGYLGKAEIVSTYDDMGHLLSERNYDVDGKLILVNGIAGTDYKRDNRGNIIEDIAVGVDGKLARGKLIRRYQYDDKDNLIEISLFDANGNPATNSQGYHKEVLSYNSRRQLVENRYYNTKGELTNYDDNNFAITRSEYNDRGLVVRISYFNAKEEPSLFHGDNEGGYASRVSGYDVYGRIIHEFYYDEDGNPTDPSVMVPESAREFDKYGNVIYIGSYDGSGNLIKNPILGWSFMRSEYDVKGHCLWTSFFDKDGSPTRCKEGYHKSVNTYTSSGMVETVSYYDTTEAPMLCNGYHKQVNTYDENGNLTQIAYYDKNGRATNRNNYYHRIVFTYHSDETMKDRKVYNVAGTMLLHEQFVNGEWTEVRYWQRDVNDFFDGKLPWALGPNFNNAVIQSVKVLNSTTIEMVVVAPKSKYDMSNAVIEEHKSDLALLIDFFRETIRIPSSVKFKGVLKDSKGRVLHTLTK